MELAELISPNPLVRRRVYSQDFYIDRRDRSQVERGLHSWCLYHLLWFSKICNVVILAKYSVEPLGEMKEDYTIQLLMVVFGLLAPRNVIQF